MFSLLFKLTSLPEASCACLPWSSTACTRWRDQMDFRWILRNGEQQDNSTDCQDVIFRFHATVDEIQRFQLNNTAFMSSMNSTINPVIQHERDANETFWTSIWNVMRSLYPPKLLSEPSLILSYLEKPSFLSMYGTGPKSRFALPRSHFPGRVQVYEPRAPECNHGPAIVSMLVFNTTLDHGRFLYESNNTAPVGVGFHPTCSSSDICKMDATMKCIGLPGQRNCAICLDPLNPSDIVGKDISIFNTYYGTDSKGHRLMSGSSNPLNFRQLAMDAIYNKIATDLSLLGDTLKTLNPFQDVDKDPNMLS